MVSLPPGTIRHSNLQLQNESPFMFTALNLVNTVTNVLLGAVAMNAFVYANRLASWSNAVAQHIYLCVFGYLILMVQAILSVNIHTGWARAFSCRNKKAVHSILQIIGSVLGLAGCLRILLAARKSYDRGYLHGIFGIIAMVLTILSLIGGVINLYASKINVNMKFLRIVHTTLGCLTVISALVAMVFPAQENIYKRYFGEANKNLVTALTILSLIFILVSPIVNVRRMLAM